MPDKKLTDNLSNKSPILSNGLSDNEIIKALKKLLELVLVEGCLQRAKTISNILDLINRLQEKNSNLTSDLTSLQKDLTSLQAENERYKKYYFQHEYDKWEKEIKAEAYKEFADKLKEKKFELNDQNEDIFYAVEVADIDNLLKELVGDSNA